MNQQRTWFITGGAGGIGKCLVYYLIGLKEKVVALDIKSHELLEMKKILRNEHFYPYTCDLSHKASIDNVIEDLKTKDIHVDVLVHNAVFHQKGMMETNYDDMVLGMKVNVVAPMYLTKSLVPLLNPLSSVIHILSTRSKQSEPNSENYAAAKGALSSLTHAMMMSLKGIARVNAISPGWIDTSYCEIQSKTFQMADHLQHPSQRIGAPMDIIDALLFLADPKHSFINGETIEVDGGMSKMMVYHNDHGWTYQPK